MFQRRGRGSGGLGCICASSKSLDAEREAITAAKNMAAFVLVNGKVAPKAKLLW